MGSPVAAGEFAQEAAENVIDFPAKVKGRYFRLRAISEVAGRPWTSIAELRPLVDRAVGYLQKEMDRGRIRQADPRLIAALCYATVTGIATEPELLRSVGWQPTTADLRRLRSELLAFLRAALAPAPRR